ncbi:MAG TPA: MBOAT family protein [Candidatus Dorea intestinavium]|nr:MBOAT family protein [Candidatus Dorea intestinavium]
MVFSSIVFICIFLPLVIILYNLIPNRKAKNLLLIIVSLLFYAYGEPIYVFLMILSTILNYIFGRVLISEKERTRKTVLFIAVLTNIGMLILFKYSDMLVSTVNIIAKTKYRLPGIRLPIGISFFTFQALSYVIDVYRRQVKPQKKYTNVLLYISFFPQLIAGPIVKYYDIENEIETRNSNIKEMAEGFRRFCLGLGKKVLVSNTMAYSVDIIFGTDLRSINAPTAWIAAIAYMLQIYFDFSGYSDMAIGLGQVFGFHFKENFNYPYESDSIKEFWHRWHISLSTWFKEYLYIPLGGNRKGKIRTALNKLIVFFTTGLWHGANWTFVVWGLWHGFFLLFEDYVPIKKMPKVLRKTYALLVICVGFVIFRADTLTQGIIMVKTMFLGWTFSLTETQVMLEQLTPLFIVTLLLGIIGSTSIFKKTTSKGYIFSILILFLSIVSIAGSSYNPFIYFRF